MAWIAGKMTAVMQLTDTSVAFSLKRHVEAVKAEVRRLKRGQADWETVWGDEGRKELRCESKDLLWILTEAWRRMKHEDEVEDPDRLLRAARRAGWLSYRGDPVRKCLVRADEEAWTQGRLGHEDLGEVSHRHPQSWWAGRYSWLEGGEPVRPQWTKSAGFGVSGLQSMRDEFPEQAPREEVGLKCLNLGRGVKIDLHSVEIGEDDNGKEPIMTFGKMGEELIPEVFLRTQRELREAAKLRAMLSRAEPKKWFRTRLSKQASRLRVKTKLKNMKRKAHMKSFLEEVRAHQDSGYSCEQLLRSFVPDIGGEIKVSAAEVKASMEREESIFWIYY